MKTICITLPETPERKAAAIDHFKQRGVQARFFPGIDGKGFGLLTRHSIQEENGLTMGYKHVGLCLSHYMVWSGLDILPKSNTHFMILEDDARFPNDWSKRTDKALEDAPKDFDILLIGSCCCEDKPKTLVAGEVFDVRWPSCTHAYIVARKALPVLLKTQRKIWTLIDQALIANTFPLLKVYTVLPRIVEQSTPIAP